MKVAKLLTYLAKFIISPGIQLQIRRENKAMLQSAIDLSDHWKIRYKFRICPRDIVSKSKLAFSVRTPSKNFSFLRQRNRKVFSQL